MQTAVMVYNKRIAYKCARGIIQVIVCCKESWQWE